jgi:hypothetical protein
MSDYSDWSVCDNAILSSPAWEIPANPILSSIAQCVLVRKGTHAGFPVREDVRFFE